MENLSLMSKLFDAIANSSKSRYVFITDLEKKLSMWSPSAVEEFALPEDYVFRIGEIWEQKLHPMDRKRYHESIEDLMSGKASKHYMTYRVLNKNNEYVVCTASGSVIREENGKALFFVGTIDNHGIPSDFDTVTSLYTKEKLLDSLRDFKDENLKYNILFVGISNLADINNIYGYDIGKKVIMTFADYLLGYIGKSEIYCISESRFAILSTELELSQMQEIYDDFVTYGRRRLEIEGVKITLLFGGSCTEIKKMKADEHDILNNGMAALEESITKKHGELVVFSNNRLSYNNKKLVVVNAIRNSINEDFKGFYLHYQPVFDAMTGEMVGAEALVRWEREPYGFISPTEFIPWIEDDPLFYELGMWIARNSMKDFKDNVLSVNPDMFLSINISYTQLERSDFRRDLMGLIRELDFPPERLNIELTERCSLLDMQLLVNEVTFLKSKGINTLLDDFGAGFSPIDLMISLPLSGIKFDKSFVADLEMDERKRYVVESIISCGKNLGIATTIEGIESDNVAIILREFGADYYQGFLYSEPVGIDELIEQVS